MSNVTKWKEFWYTKDDPLHQESTTVHYKRYASELKILFQNEAYDSVLEIGCGNGALYPFLGFESARYKGIDFSGAMLADFGSKHPNVDLVCADGHSYSDNQKYDLIFSNGVIQYFDRHMLWTHFEMVSKMLSDRGVFVMASIPWVLMRRYYELGKVTGDLNRVAIPGFIDKVKSFLFHRVRNRMGRWYATDEINSIAIEKGFIAENYGSMHYPYRFHTVLRKMDNNVK